METHLNIDEIRSRIPGLKHCSYLNMSYGPKPTPVTDEVVRMARFIEEYATLSKEVMDEIERVYEGARVDVARLLGASTDEIALTRHVSEGINIVATGIDWEPGDEVIVTDEEHPAGSLPWMNLKQRRGIEVRQLPLAPYETEGIVERLEAMITSRTKLLCLSHVSTRTGFVLPAREVADVAHKHGVPVLLDGAHAVGLIPVDVKALGCDYYSGCGHKWLLAPQGTGFLYVDADRLDDLKITWIGASSAPTWDEDTYEFEPIATAAKFEFGTRDKAVFSSLSTAISMAEEVGIENIARRSWELADHLRRRLTDVPGFTLRTPLDPVRSTGISTFDIGFNGRDITERLWEEHRILVSGREDELRVSIPYFALEEEVDKLVDVLASLDREQTAK